MLNSYWRSKIYAAIPNWPTAAPVYVIPALSRTLGGQRPTRSVKRVLRTGTTLSIGVGTRGVTIAGTMTTRTTQLVK